MLADHLSREVLPGAKPGATFYSTQLPNDACNHRSWCLKVPRAEVAAVYAVRELR